MLETDTSSSRATGLLQTLEPEKSSPRAMGSTHIILPPPPHVHVFKSSRRFVQSEPTLSRRGENLLVNEQPTLHGAIQIDGIVIMSSLALQRKQERLQYTRRSENFGVGNELIVICLDESLLD
jgi:hypothetical protein